MSTDLFGTYYNNPKKQYIYSNLTCSNGMNESDNNFTISDNSGTISNGSNTLASIDLSDIKEYLTDWKNESRIIEPYQFLYFKGYSEGLSYQRNVYIKIPEYITENENFMNLSGLDFNMKYIKNGCSFMTRIKGSGTPDTTFIEEIQNKLNKLEIPADISYEDGTIIITSTVLGYEFYISSDFTSNSIKFITTILPEDAEANKDKQIIYLNEYCPAYVPSKKYKNGAFRGIILKPTYPEYNAESITQEQRALEIAHIQNRIEFDTPVRFNSDNGCILLYKKTIKDVVDSYNEIGELEKFNKWRNIDNQSNCMYEDNVSGENITGLYGFINWVQKYNKWAKFGSLYAIVTPKDFVDSNYQNLIGSFIVYNPNPFPIKIDCMLFA